MDSWYLSWFSLHVRQQLVQDTKEASMPEEQLVSTEQSKEQGICHQAKV